MAALTRPIGFGYGTRRTGSFAGKGGPISVAVAETAAATDSQASALTAAVAVAETAAASETQTGAVTSGTSVTVAESVAASETQTAVANFNAAVGESAAATDTATATVAVSRPAGGGLRVLAEADLGLVLEDSLTGFGWPVTLRNPGGLTRSDLVGASSDIHQVIDPDTGQVISGRLATVALRIASLYSRGFTLPRGVADETGKPWVVIFDDINGLPYTFKVRSANPDRALGVVVCTLEAYTL